MKNAYELLGKLKYKHPFIYEVNAKHYLIGAYTFRTCTDEESELYKQFCECYKKVKEQHPNPREIKSITNDLRELAKIVHTITTLSNSPLTEENRINMSRFTWELISACSDHDYENWEKQIDQFLDASSYESRVDLIDKVEKENEK